MANFVPLRVSLGDKSFNAACWVNIGTQSIHFLVMLWLLLEQM